MLGDPVTFGFVLWMALVGCLVWLVLGLVEIAVRRFCRRRAVRRALRALRGRR
ncbi:hypothetical protein BH23CHL8_BH23CHL8_32110 [soil metagenome]